MAESFQISMTKEEFNKLINDAVSSSINKNGLKKDRLLTKEEAADYLNETPVVFSHLVAQGKVKSLTLKKNLVFSVYDLDQYLKA